MSLMPLQQMAERFTSVRPSSMVVAPSTRMPLAVVGSAGRGLVRASQVEIPENLGLAAITRMPRNTIERLVVMSSGKTATKADLPINIRDHSFKTRFAAQLKDALPSTIGDIEKTRLIEALTRTGWNQAKAARILGITPRQIGYKIKKYDLTQS